MGTPAWYSVNLRASLTCEPDEHEITIRQRAAELAARDADRFFVVVRKAHQRERSGVAPLDALEQSLDVDDRLLGHD